MNEDLKKLFEGSELSEEFQTSIQTMFKEAVDKQVAEAKKELEEELTTTYEAKAKEYTEYVVSELEEKTNAYVTEEILPMVEKYIDYAVKEFSDENKAQATDSLKVEAADKFLKGFASLTESFNVTIPEGQEDAVKALEAKLEEAQTRFDKALDESKELQGKLNQIKADAIVAEKSADLTESQKEKFASVVAKIDFKDEEQYTTAVADLFESYFPAAKVDNEEKPEDKKVVKEAADPWFDNLFSRI